MNMTYIDQTLLVGNTVLLILVGFVAAHLFENR